MADKKISELPLADALTGPELMEFVQGGVNKRGTPDMLGTFIGAGITREFNRTFSETLVFDKNEIEYAPHEATGDLNFTVSPSGLNNQFSAITMEIIFDGTQAVFFTGVSHIYGITNGQILDAGSYEFYFIASNGKVRVNVPGTSAESSALTQLLTPSDFAVVADGEDTLDMSWTDVANEVGYQIERSDNGVSGWTLYSSPAANATSDTETGLSPGTTVYYRIKALGDGVSFSDSPYTIASGTTTDAGDVTAPTFTFNPVNGSAIWPVNKAFTITANEPLQNADGSAIDNSNVAALITLKQTNSGGANIAFTAVIDASKTVITIAPTTIFGINQLVYVAIDGVEDASGNESALTSITFTTTEYTYHNGTSNRLRFGNILNSLFTAADANFWIERTVNNANLSGTRMLVAKLTSAGDGTFQFYYNNKVFVFFFALGAGAVNQRAVIWENTDMDSGENVIVLKYDGSIDTNDGLDRCTLLINGVVQTGGYISNPIGALGSSLRSTTSQLALDIPLNAAGTPINANWYEGEAKDFIIRSNSGATVEINVEVERVGTDSSGNGRNGTWV